MLFLNENDLKRCLDLDSLRASMKEALQSYSSKTATSFPRAVFNTQSGGAIAPIGFMPAIDYERDLLGYKAITVFHENRRLNLNPHQGVVVLLDRKTGKLKCILDGSFLTAVRTAAVSAAATDALSKLNSKTLALIGSGRQAIEHVYSIARIRPIEHIQVYSRSQKSFDQFNEHFNANPKLKNQSTRINRSRMTNKAAANFPKTCTIKP